MVKSPLILANDGQGIPAYFKLDYLLPSGSFKYREAHTTLEYMKINGFKQVVITTSGNTGRAFEELAKEYNVEVRIFTWDSFVSREETLHKAQRFYSSHDSSTTLLFSGDNALKRQAHDILAEEIKDELGENIDSLIYVQTTGSGKGIDAVKRKYPKALTIPTRPSEDTFIWSPAVVDGPYIQNMKYPEPAQIIKAYEYLVRLFRHYEGDTIGLEGATALAGWWEYSRTINEKNLNSEIPLIVNLTGVFRGKELPW